MAPEALYEELCRWVREEALLGSVAATLEWDEETCLPPGGVDNRGRQMALLAGLLHERATHPRRAELLDALAGSSLCADPEGAAAVNIRELRKAYERERKVPRALVEELAEATSVAAAAWADARARRSFAPFAPQLEHVIALKRAEAACLAGGGDLYEALLDDHEEGMTIARLEATTPLLRRGLQALLDRVRGATRRPDPALCRGDFPVATQRELGAWIAARMGFDFERGRLDDSVHPFTVGLGPGDCRITARWDARDLSVGLFAVFHEVGHGLYEQGLDASQWGLPAGEQVSDGIDESQSRLWENLVGRSHGFWRYLWPEVAARFPALAGRDRDAVYRAMNRVEPSLIRAVADEVTYHLHIFIRVDLERSLLAGDLAVRDLPAAWAAAYRDVLGVTPVHDGEGCLQDGHWAEGLIGYFPTYTLGDVYAAEVGAAAARHLGPLDAALAVGELGALRAWLSDRIYRHGSRFLPLELIARATGAVPRATTLLDRLARKVDALYG
jgi:carboxypeptidase Taq